HWGIFHAANNCAGRPQNLRMQRHPIAFVNSLCPTPESALVYTRSFIAPQSLVKIDGLTRAFINHQHHFVIVNSIRRFAMDLTLEVIGRDLRLLHSHMAEFWSAEVNAVTHGINSIQSFHTHRILDVDISLAVAYAQPIHRTWTNKRWD